MEVSVMQKVLCLLIGLALLNSPPLWASNETETTQPQPIPTKSKTPAYNDDC